MARGRAKTAQKSATLADRGQKSIVENVLAARVAMRKRKKTWVFLVKWKGEMTKENTWQAADSDCFQGVSILEAFWRRVDADGKSRDAGTYKLGEQLSCEPNSNANNTFALIGGDTASKNKRAASVTSNNDAGLAKRHRQESPKKEDTVRKVNPISVAPSFRGKFNVYSMEIQELYDEYGVHERNTDPELVPDYARLYEAIQSKRPAPTARMRVRGQEKDQDNDQGIDQEDDDDEDDEDFEDNVAGMIMGRMEGRGVNDSISEVPFNIIITEIERHANLAFTDEESMSFVERKDPVGPGIVAKLDLAGDGRHHGLLQYFGGYIKLVKVWSDEQGAELFEGLLSIDVRFVAKFWKRGKTDESTRMAVWVVHSTGDDEDEDEDEEGGCFSERGPWRPRYPGQNALRTIR